MNGREIAAYMKENGFELVRETATGNYWSDGTSRLYAPSGRGGDFRAIRNLQAEVKRAIARRVIEKAIPPKEREPKMETQIVQREARRIIVPPPALKVPLMEAARIVPSTPPVRNRRGRALDANGRLTTYSETDKEILKIRITELIKAGDTYALITAKLNDEGFRNSEGGMMTLGAVGSLIVDFGLGRRRMQKKEDARILAEAKKQMAAGQMKIDPMPEPVKQAPLLREEPKAPIAEAKADVKTNPEDKLALDIMHSSDLSSDKKLKLLKALMEA